MGKKPLNFFSNDSFPGETEKNHLNFFSYFFPHIFLGGRGAENGFL